MPLSLQGPVCHYLRIKFVLNVLYHRIYDVDYIFVLFTVHAWLGFSSFNFFVLKVSVIVTGSTF